MRNYCLVLLMFMCFGSVCAPEARAQEAPAWEEELEDPEQVQEQNEPVQEAAPAVSELSEKEAKIRLKREELKAVEKGIKELRRLQQGERQAEQLKIRGEKQARLEELKLQDPVKYQEELAKQFEQQKKREKFRKEQIEDKGAKAKMTHEQWLEYIKKRNPKMYELVVKKDILQEELKNLRSGRVP